MRLDHVNIHCHQQEPMRDFLVALLGLKVGWRPGFVEPGYWLYYGDDTSPPARGETPPPEWHEPFRAVIHLWPRSSGPGAGWVDHLCFGLFGNADEKRAELQRQGFFFRESRLPDTDIVQFFVTGPEDIKIELQCRPVQSLTSPTAT